MEIFNCMIDEEFLSGRLVGSQHYYGGDLI